MSKNDPFRVLYAFLGLIFVLSIVQSLSLSQRYSHFYSGSSPLTAEPQTSISLYSYPEGRPLTYLDWGTLTPSQTATQDVLIVSSGSKSYNLSVSTSEWVPSEAPEYMAFSWNSTGQILVQWVCARFTLEVFPNCTGITNFSFKIIIDAVGI